MSNTAPLISIIVFETYSAVCYELGLLTIWDIRPKRILNSNLAQSRSSMIYFVIVHFFKCCAQHGIDTVVLCAEFQNECTTTTNTPSINFNENNLNIFLNSRSLSVQDCLYDLITTAVRHWYDGSVWSALSTFSTTISTTTDTTALTMLTTTPTLLPICYHD